MPKKELTREEMIKAESERRYQRIKSGVNHHHRERSPSQEKKKTALV